ncbi:MAG: hypothetical protein WBN72_09500 [Nitrososphaeraceae archaeon]
MVNNNELPRTKAKLEKANHGIDLDHNGLKTYLKQVITEIKKERE